MGFVAREGERGVDKGSGKQFAVSDGETKYAAVNFAPEQMVYLSQLC